MKRSDDPKTVEPPGDVLDLGEFVPYYLRVIANRLGQVASRTYNQKYGIGLNEWSCLATLAKEDEVSASRICEMSGFDKAVISRSVNALESKGFIESRPVPNHNRRRILRLTPAGRELYMDIRGLALDREERLLAGLSPAERASLLDNLRTMHRNANQLVAEEAFTRQQGRAMTRGGTTATGRTR